MAAVKTPLSQTDFSSYVAPVLNSGADVLVLNHYGGNMVNSLTSAVEFGLRAAQANGKNFEIVVPLYSRLMAKGAGKNVAGIFGTCGWHWSLENTAGSRYSGTNAFVKSFGERPDIVAIREAGGADVASTTPITQIDEYFSG